MLLNIKNREVEALAAEVAALAGETKTEAVRRALLERKQRLAFQVNRKVKGANLLRFLESEVWPKLAASDLGRALTKAERESILGYGSEGV